jgi:hypothetical protein
VVHSEEELIRRFSAFIADGMGDAVARKPHFGVPEEDVTAELPMPYLTLFYLGDELYAPGWASGKTYFEQIGQGAEAQFERWKMPESVKFYFQLDIYSQSQLNLVQLSTRLSKVINRRGTVFLDSDGDPISVELTDVQDFGRDSFRLEKSEERIFRRSYTYSLECVYQANDVPIETVGPVLTTDITFKPLDQFGQDYPEE